MPKIPIPHEDAGDEALTGNLLVKWVGIIASIMTVVISVVWFAAIMRIDIMAIQQQCTNLKQTVEMEQINQNQEIERLRNRADKTEQAISSLSSKIDVAVAILERIEKKVGDHP